MQNPECYECGMPTPLLGDGLCYDCEEVNNLKTNKKTMKTYIEGTSCKAISGQFGEFFNISIKVEKLQQYANEKGYVNMVLSKRREVGQYGDTHYFTLNEYKPEGKKEETKTDSEFPEF